MRRRALLPTECTEACQQLSLRVDSELSEFENLLLEAHLAGCADCRAFAQSITDFTSALRTVPVEQPTVPFQLPGRHKRMHALLASSFRPASAAAAVALVALSGLATLHTTRGSTSASGAPSADRGEAQLVLELHERQLQHLDNLGRAKKLVVPHGLAAAERDGRR
jgi:predicted anti-sigma-YlaC factor YlaD